MDDRVRAAQTATLEAFVLRARRIEGHSLAQDFEKMQEIAVGTFKAEINPTLGKAILRQSLPPEEEVESLAARVRPLILEGDPVAHHKATKALKSLLQGCENEKFLTDVESLRTGWKGIIPAGEGLAAYSVQVYPEGVEAGALDATDNELAFGWFYGDVVHADAKRRETTDGFGIRERFRAAAPLVFRITRQAIMTLNMIRFADSSGYIKLDSKVWESEVLVTDTEFETESKIYVAPVDAAPPKPGDPLSPEWQSIVTMRDEFSPDADER